MRHQIPSRNFAGQFRGQKSFGLGSLAAILLICATSSISRAQVSSSLMLDPWQGKDYLESIDNLVIESAGRISGDHARDQIVYDNSYGRFRFDNSDSQALSIGYRWVSVAFNPRDHAAPEQLNDIGAAVGFHVANFDDWKIGAVLGGGFSGDNIFAGSNGFIGIGHVTALRQINDTDYFLLSVDYDNSNALLPDVPLPGFVYAHKTDDFSYRIGFPSNSVRWKPFHRLTLEASYEVPYNAVGRAEIPITEHFGLYAQAANLFHAFEPEHGDRDDRIFFQGARAEVGVHLIYGHLFGQYVDVNLGVGYAFDQRISRGFDVRGISTAETMSDEPYIGIMIRGKL